MKSRQSFILDKLLKVQVAYVPARAKFRQVWGNMRPFERGVALMFAALIIASVIAPVLGMISSNQRYQLNDQTKQLVGGATSDNLAKFITTDKETGDLIFKQDLMKQSSVAPSSGVKQQGGNYSVTIYKDTKKGISYFDPESTQSFTIKPEFELMAPEQTDGHIVMPLGVGSGQQVVTLKGNGIKEDIILNKYQGDEKKFTYSLDLPVSMEARLTDNGEIEIYTGSDMGLFGAQISYGSDKDKQLVEAAQKKAKKDKLVFVIPAPVIKQAGGLDLPPETQSKFVLKDNKLTVESTGLKNLQYPISIDPSIIVTSSNDFDLGNDGGDTNVNNGQIERAAVTGGAISLTANSDSYSISRTMPAVAAYNNRLYVMGGCSTVNGSFQCSAVTTDVRVGNIDTNSGQVTWLSNLSSDNLSVAVYATQATIYNGYIYIVGGVTGTGAGPSTTDAVYYAKINNSTGRLGGWTLSANSLPLSGSGLGMNGTVAYGGFLYTAAGCKTILVSSALMSCTSGSGGSPSSDIYSARIKPDGSIDSWNDVGDVTINGFIPNYRYNAAAFVYNGVLHVSTVTLASTDLSILQTYKINNDGSLTGIDLLSVQNSNARYSHARAGHVYGSSTSTALVLSSTASVSSSQTTISSSGCNGAVSYKSFVYCTGTTTSLLSGVSNSTNVGTYATPGALNTFGADTSVTGSLNSAGVNLGGARKDVCAVAYDGYLYLVGGSNNGGTIYYDGVKSAELAATGGIGSWTNSTNFFVNIGGNPSFRSQLMCEAYNGQLYIMGGSNSTTNYTDIQVATINKGAVGTFTVATGKFSTNRILGSSAIKLNSNDGNVYLYAFGGGNTSIEYGKVEYTQSNFADNTGAQRVSNVVTLTVSAGHGIVAGNRISVDAVDNSFDISDVAVTSVTATTITYPQTGADDADADGGTLVKSDVCGWNGSTWDCTSGAGGQNIKTSSVSMPSCIVVSSFTIKDSQTTVINKDTVYMIGGRGENSVPVSATLPCTWRANINTSGDNGDIGSWTQGTSMTTFRKNHTAVVWNGFIYAAGGTDNTGNNLNTTEKSAIDGSGELGSWSADTSTGASVYMHHHTSVAYNGYLYVMGGVRASTAGGAGSTSASTSSAYINNGGSGGNSAIVQDADVLPNRRYHHASFAYDGYVYVAGGVICTQSAGADPSCSNTQLTDTVLKSSISGGTYSSWTSAGTLSTARWGARMTIYNGKVFIIGGCNVVSVVDCLSASNQVLDSVESGDVDSSTHNFTNWGAVAGSPGDIGTGRLGFGMTQYGGYIYIAGGCNNVSFAICTGSLNTVTYASIDSSGNLSNWSTGSAFTNGRAGNFLTAYNGYLYVGGGSAFGFPTFDDIQYAQIGSLGSVGSWFTDPHQLDKRIYNNTAVHAYGENGHLHVFTNLTIQSAPIGNNGALNGKWNVSNNFPGTLNIGYSSQGLAYYQGYAYYTGGLVLFSAQDYAHSFYTYTQPRVANYERWLDTDVDTTPVNIIVNGTNTGNPGALLGGINTRSGGIQIFHKDIKSADTAWGTATYLNPGNSSILSRVFGYSVNENMARSYLLNFTIDDTHTFTFGSSGNTTAITEFSLYYHAASVRRLRHGGTFTGEVKQSLDTPPLTQ